MKQSLKCPKCDGARIWVIERFRIPSETASGQELPLVPHQEGATGFLGFSKLAPHGAFDLWACDACGYTELYARDLSGLKPSEERGVRLIDAAVEPKGPFR